MRGSKPTPQVVSLPGSVASANSNQVKKSSTLAEIQRLQRERDERRRAMEQNKIDRANEEQRNREAGHPGDVDFQRNQLSLLLCLFASKIGECIDTLR